VRGIDLAGREAVIVNEGGPMGKSREARHLLGHPPRDFLARLEAHSPALLHAHFGTSAVNALPLQRRLGLPLLVTFHGYDATQRSELRNGPMAWRYGRRRPLLTERADTLLAVSDHIRERVIALGVPESRVQTHYIGVDLSKFTPAPLEQRQPIVLGVGRFVEKKGFEYLIDAMAAVQRTLPELELVLIGSGELEGALRARAAEKLGSFRIFGPCSPEEVAGWMRRARVLAAPSVIDRSGNTEGLPITILEALASGLPVVASRHAGIPEAVIDGESGFLVDERGAVGLTRHILDLARDDDGWTALSASCRLTAERSFDLATQTRQLESLYAQVT
jgi:colanic acid/amylovoran biosynthesis glycosyltransferase